MFCYGLTCYIIRVDNWVVFQTTVNEPLQLAVQQLTQPQQQSELIVNRSLLFIRLCFHLSVSCCLLSLPTHYLKNVCTQTSAMSVKKKNSTLPAGCTNCVECTVCALVCMHAYLGLITPTSSYEVVCVCKLFLPGRSITEGYRKLFGIPDEAE